MSSGRSIYDGNCNKNFAIEISTCVVNCGTFHCSLLLRSSATKFRVCILENADYDGIFFGFEQWVYIFSKHSSDPLNRWPGPQSPEIVITSSIVQARTSVTKKNHRILMEDLISYKIINQRKRARLITVLSMPIFRMLQFIRSLTSFFNPFLPLSWGVFKV